MTPPVQSFVQLGTLIASLRAITTRFPPEIAKTFVDGLTQIQDYCDQTSQRLAELQATKTSIEDQLDATAGASAGYLIVTVGKQQYKLQAYALK